MSARLNFEDYPLLDSAEVGYWPNAGYGEIGGVRCHCVESGASAALAAGVDASSTTITLAGATRFPTAPFDIQVGMELMRATSIDGNALTVQRAQGGTRAMAHAAGMVAYECRERYVYLVAEHPVLAVDALYIDGVRQMSGFTVYTGQSGDELAGYEGRAVVAISAGGSATRQYNRASARTVQIDATPSCFSSAALVDGSQSSYQAIGSGGIPAAWVAYAASTAPGSPITQTHTAQVANPGASDVEVKLIVQRSGAHIIERSFNVEAGSSATLAIEQEGGQMSDGLSVVPVSGTLHVRSISKTMRIDSAMFEPAAEQAMAEPVMDTLLIGHTLGVSGKHSARIAYNDSALGTPYTQRHSVSVKELDGAPCRVRIAASTGERMEADVAANSTETLTLEVPGGAWADATSIVALSGRFRVEEATKLVAYHSAVALATLATEAKSTARRVVGDVVSVDARMCVDTDGSYAGAGTLIERPDHIARHFITSQMGMDASAIDLASFNAAGASYAGAIPGGYRMGFLMDRNMKPSQILSSLAMQCRSTLHHSRGYWQMRYLPDVAPAPDATISQSELAGDGSHFIFSRTPVGELSNSITARYAWRDADNSYAGLATSQDASSIALYGGRALEVELWAVQDAAMAAHVLSHMLRERAHQRLTVELGVFFEYFGLEVGDTIEVAGGIYAGRSFFIEELRRVDKYTARIRGREWWA